MVLLLLRAWLGTRNLAAAWPTANSRPYRRGERPFASCLLRGIFILAGHWWLPIPIYIEHTLFPLFWTAAIAGYWGGLQALAARARRWINAGDGTAGPLPGADACARSRWRMPERGQQSWR